MSGFPTVKGISGADATAIAEQSNSLAKVKTLSQRDVKSKKDVEKAASGFEALLLHEMLKSMWATVEPGSLLGEDSNASQIYRDMFNQAIADNTAKGRGIGIKKVVEAEIGKKGRASK